MTKDSVDPGDGQTDRSSVLTECEYDWAVVSPSIAVIETIAAVEGVDPVSLSTNKGITLYDSVDTDAIDRLVTNGAVDNVSITFNVNGYTVGIENNTITIKNRSTIH